MLPDFTDRQRREQAAFVAKSRSLAPDYKTELLPPPDADPASKP